MRLEVERWYVRRSNMRHVCGQAHPFVMYSDAMNTDGCDQMLAYPACARVQWADFEPAPEHTIMWNQHYPPCPERDMQDHHHEPHKGIAIWCNSSRFCPGAPMLGVTLSADPARPA